MRCKGVSKGMRAYLFGNTRQDSLLFDQKKYHHPGQGFAITAPKDGVLMADSRRLESGNFLQVPFQLPTGMGAQGH